MDTGGRGTISSDDNSHVAVFLYIQSGKLNRMIKVIIEVGNVKPNTSIKETDVVKKNAEASRAIEFKNYLNLMKWE